MLCKITVTQKGTNESIVYDNVTKHRHTDEGLVLEFEDKPPITIKNELIERTQIGQATNEGVQQINS